MTQKFPLDKFVSKYVIRPCPWCKKTPLLDASTAEHSGDTWLWYIKCVNDQCLMKPSTKYVPVRNTSKRNFDSQKKKVEELVRRWNTGNPVPAYEETILFHRPP